MYWGADVLIHDLFISVPVRDEFLVHVPATLHPGKEPPGTHWIRGCVGPRPALDNMVKIFKPMGPGIPASQ
jgi:hypothetical protein